MLWSIDSYQNGVSTDQYHMTVLSAYVLTYRAESGCVFEVMR